MKKITILIIIISCLVVTSLAYANDTDDKITSLFKTVYYSGDSGVKVLELKYKKIAEDEYESLWECSIKIKSSYKKTSYCQTSIVVTDKEGTPVSQGSKGSNNIATLFNSDIRKGAVVEKTKEINFNKKDIDRYIKSNYEFAIHTSCSPN